MGAGFLDFVRAVISADLSDVSGRLLANPRLATAVAKVGATRGDPEDFFFAEIAHYLYQGDTALHMAAAAFRRPAAQILVAAGADVGARNRRGAQPLHYAADANHWDPDAQADTIAYLISAGADPTPSISQAWARCTERCERDHCQRFERCSMAERIRGCQMVRARPRMTSRFTIPAEAARVPRSRADNRRAFWICWRSGRFTDRRECTVGRGGSGFKAGPPRNGNRRSSVEGSGMDPGATLLSRTSQESSSSRFPSGFPPDLLSQSARRLRMIAVLYAAVFLMAGVLPALLFTADRTRFLGNVIQWAPAATGIVVALVVAVIVRCPPLPVATAMNIGLVFEVASSYAIAAGEFGDPRQIDSHQGYLGLSWVAVWVVLFTIVVPTAPRRALVAALASVSSVSVIIGLHIASGTTTLRIGPAQFFVGLVFPYLVVVCMAYFGARVVYRLGGEINRARELGSYHLEEKLGQGGMGEVWRARHRMLARPAAIKLIRRSVAGGVSDAALQRFEREAQVIARLRSPHTVNLFDFGVASDGAFYYAMELLEGLDADSLVRRFGAVAPDRAIHLVRQVCHSLSEAQSCGLVHRDIKPANIFVCKYGEEFDFVKVLDFGIVRAVRDVADTGPVETQENVLHGTPAFMAPEQAMGTEVDGRADVYATGCVAYWLLTGELVFTAETPMGVLVQHAQSTPSPPSARTDQPIPRSLDQLVLACLAKDPAKRPQSAKELAQQLAAIEVANAWTSDRARAWWEAHHVIN